MGNRYKDLENVNLKVERPQSELEIITEAQNLIKLLQTFFQLKFKKQRAY